VLMINPDNIKTYAYRGLSEAYHGDTSEMRLDFERALKLSPKSSTNYILLAKTKLLQNDYMTALQDFDTAVIQDNDDPMAFFERGIAKLDRGDAKGCDDLKQALKLGERKAADEIKTRCK
jgi:tetratricopeptide (TPR) repeat protein